jgi:hypothetical protein
MTRINCAIPPAILTDQHLLAEHREIKRLPQMWQIWVKNGRKTKVPKDFTLNTGHCCFFYNKGQYTLNRYRDIHQECLKRGFNVQDYSGNWDKYLPTDMGNHEESLGDKTILLERLEARIVESKQNPLFWGKPTTRYHYNNLIR